MKILHCCLSSFYIDGYSYQENILPRFNLLHGHDVEIIASTETFDDKGHLTYIQPSSYQTEEGIPIIRVPYKKFLPNVVMRKFRSYKGVYKLISEFEPDVILFHGGCAYELLNVVNYRKKHSNVKLYVDSHADYHVSAKNWLSKKILHEVFYRTIIHKCISYIEKVFYITEETKDFFIQEYKISEQLMEYYPLGGEVVEEEEKRKWREHIRKQHQIDESTLVVMHSGKLDQRKETDVLIKGFSKVQSDNVLLFIAGNIPPENEKLWDYINSDTRIKWLGWLNADDLRHYLCACDIYAQPGGQSITMQNAVCCGVPVMIYPHKSHLKLCKDNVMWVKNEDDIYNEITKVLINPELLEKMSNASMKIAREVLDYHILAARIERQ
ncbi:MAG: glycosyltransferase family 4 protein [Lachnoclostridium sp.]|nr:glycosyltransferase family 4 protein [Lachnospira sp.]MCM1246990.1 glycosyltransferase family 4 protein [Lachnoclostridium sp.]MCM1535043.1 glycosyltransferase family 4 protein [Clostridium sp.]